MKVDYSLPIFVLNSVVKSTDVVMGITLLCLCICFIVLDFWFDFFKLNWEFLALTNVNL